MKIIDYFRQGAKAAEKQLDELVDQQEGQHAKQRALDHLKERFETMVADGVLSREEMASLRGLMKSGRVDTKALEALYGRLADSDGSVSTASNSELGDLVRSSIDDSRRAIGESEALTQFRIQMGVSDFTHGQDAVSKLLKIEHDAYMTAIRNIAG